MIGTLAAFVAAFFAALGWVVGKFQEVFVTLAANNPMPFAADVIQHLPVWMYGALGAGLAVLLIARGAHGLDRRGLDRTYMIVVGIVALTIVLHILALHVPVTVLIERLRR